MKHKGEYEAGRQPESYRPCFIPAESLLPEFYFRVPLRPLWLPLLNQSVQNFFCLLVQIRRRAIHDAGGFAKLIEQKHGWDRSDVAEGLGGSCVGNGPMQVGIQRVHCFADLVLW